MSFDQLLLSRPQYSKRLHPFTIHSHNPTPFCITTHVSPVESPKISDLSTIHKSQDKWPFSDKIKTQLKSNEIMKTLQTTIKSQKVTEAYNLLSDFNDKKQIIQSLKQLQTADERIQLIDKILERKEEMQVANLRLKAKKLEPIFNVIRRKLKLKQRLSQSNERGGKKQSIAIRKGSENSNDNQVLSTKNLDEQILDETTRQGLVIQKIQNKYAASVAFSWLTNRVEKQDLCLQNLSPETIKRNNRRNTTLKQSHKGITGLKQMITKKVSENSDEMIRLGQLKMQESLQKYQNVKDIVAKTKSKIDTGRIKSVQVNRSLRKKKTLDFFTNERKENSELNEHMTNEKSAFMFRRKLIMNE